MTTETAIDYQIPLTPDKRRTDTKSGEEEPFNNYWAEYCRRNTLGFNITALLLTPETAFRQPQNTLLVSINMTELEVGVPRISSKNIRLIEFLDQWIDEPDDLGEEFWNKFCEDIEKNRFTL